MKKGKIRINVNDIIGKRLGKLEVISYHGHVYSTTYGGDRLRHYYVCQCDCGRINYVQRGPLLNDLVHSCGCIKTNKRKMEVNRIGNKDEK